MKPHTPAIATPFAALLLALPLIFTPAPPTAGADDPAAETSEKPNDRVLILIGEGYNAGEFWQPYFGLRAAGYRIDVVGPQRGTITAGHRDRDMDFKADLALDEVDIDDYLALFIPGGYSPGNLEKYPEAIELCRRFMQAGKPVAAVCHGPRLLARAGVLDDRITTGLWRIKDELPEEWTTGKMGRYLDQAVVVDDNLITARYPWDVVPFTQRMIELFAERGGLESAPTEPRMLIVLAGPDTRTRWALLDGGLVSQGGSTRHLGHDAIARFLDEDEPDFFDFDMLVVSDGEHVEALADAEGFERLVNGFLEHRRPVVGIREAGTVLARMFDKDRIVHAEGETSQFIHKVADLAHRQAAVRGLRQALPTVYTAAIALHDALDDRVYAAMHAWLKLEGHKVALIGPKRGWVRGLNGVPVETTVTYDDQIALGRGAVIVAPGVWWPEEADSSAQQPRLDWLIDRLEVGATVMAFGLDSLYLGRMERFEGKRFAAPDQVRWSFGRDGGRYIHEPAHRTTDNLITAEGFDTVADAIGLLEKTD